MTLWIDAAYSALPGFEGQAATHPSLLPPSLFELRRGRLLVCIELPTLLEVADTIGRHRDDQTPLDEPVRGIRPVPNQLLQESTLPLRHHNLDCSAHEPLRSSRQHDPDRSRKQELCSVFAEVIWLRPRHSAQNTPLPRKLRSPPAGGRGGCGCACLSLLFPPFWIDGGRCRRDEWHRKRRVVDEPGLHIYSARPERDRTFSSEGTSDAAQPVQGWRAHHHLDSPTRRHCTAWGDPGRCLLPLASQRTRGGIIVRRLTQDCHSDPSDLNTYRGFAKKCAKKAKLSLFSSVWTCDSGTFTGNCAFTGRGFRP